MEACLAELEKYMHASSELPPLLRIGMIHYQFEAIHPFLHGNGRIGRLLVEWGLLCQPLLSLRSFIEQNRQEYYERLLAVSQHGEWEAWLLFFLDGVHQQAQDGSQRILHLQALRQQYHPMLAGEPGKNGGLSDQHSGHLHQPGAGKPGAGQFHHHRALYREAG